MRLGNKRDYLGLAACVALMSMGAPVAAASAIVEQAKDQCIVGEQSDGYLGFVPGKSADQALRREVRDINQQRKVFYAELAENNGLTIDLTAAATAEKLIAQAGRGECVRLPSGEWVEV